MNFSCVVGVLSKFTLTFHPDSKFTNKDFEGIPNILYKQD